MDAVARDVAAPDANDAGPGDAPVRDGSLDDASRDSGAEDAASEDPVVVVARALCRYFERCSAWGRLFYSFDTCVAMVSGSCLGRPMFDLDPVPTPQEAQHCAEAMAQLACGSMSDQALASACPFVAPGAEGQSCESRSCASGLYCGYDSQSCMVCLPAAGEGEPCGERQCGDGLWCAPADGGSVCARKLANGSPCTTFAECAGGVCEEGVCTEPLPDGAPCTSPMSCQSGVCAGGHCRAPSGEGEACDFDQRCADDLYCIDGVCARPGQVAEGESCGSHFECALIDGVCSAGVCVRVDLCNEIGEGEPCRYPARCAPGLYCDDTYRCSPRLGRDAPCISSEQCASGLYCSQVSGTCAPAAGEGEQCSSPDMCGEGLFCARDDYGQFTSCVPRKGDGEACSWSYECASGECRHGVCFSFSMCQARP